MKTTRQVRIGDVIIGGGNPVAVQSMTNTKTEDATATVAQLREFEQAGCDVARVTVNTEEAERALPEILRGTKLPIVADIHFSLDRALGAIRAGVHKIRFNPGNIGSIDRVKTLVAAAKDRGVPIRIGVNSGSIEKELLDKHGNTTTALVESALRHVAILEKCGFNDIVISAKASSPLKTVEAYRALAQKVDYPLHLGVTEAGYGRLAEYKSVSAMGSLLLDNIGDTIRISLTGDPVAEIYAGKDLLRAVGRDDRFVNVVSCPTCGRTVIPVEAIVKELTERTKNIRVPLTVAVMGCVVNGIGEGKDADIGVAGGEQKSALISGGEVVGTIANEDIIPALLKWIEEKTNG